MNHFPGTFQIGRKDRLWKNLSRMQLRVGKKVCFYPVLMYMYMYFFLRGGGGGGGGVMVPGHTHTKVHASMLHGICTCIYIVCKEAPYCGRIP